MAIKSIEITTIGFQLADIVVAVEDAVRALEQSRRPLIDRKIATVTDMLFEAESLPKEMESSFYSGLRSWNEERIALSGRRLINWGLVMMWTNFEAQLEAFLRLLFEERPKSFLSWGAKLSLTAEELQSYESLEAATRSLHHKALKQFGNDGIIDRMNFLCRRLNL
jgi:hypothetical protein